jgi:hypothetical protein
MNKDEAKLVELLSDKQVGTLTSEQFREAAKEWAAYCLDNFTGPTLERGIKIATALVEFVTELEASV